MIRAAAVLGSAAAALSRCFSYTVCWHPAAKKAPRAPGAHRSAPRRAHPAAGGAARTLLLLGALLFPAGLLGSFLLGHCYVLPKTKFGGRLFGCNSQPPATAFKKPA